MEYTLVLLKEYLKKDPLDLTDDVLLQILLDESKVFVQLDGVDTSHIYFDILHKYRTIHNILCYNAYQSSASAALGTSSSSSSGTGIQQINLEGLGITFAQPSTTNSSSNSLSGYGGMDLASSPGNIYLELLRKINNYKNRIA